ncbi:hypothetical protein J7337_008429 [Fusarium musae]|uniref:Uncharacterized protein n=1 Tax=Fusarium musae TaxID=1042133 RepID=A0A9P8DDK7_9HYPO|nr:hypothetical protein J7337_008429 [Fusarium musae]KAF5966442.1 hypothetical protein FCOIX_12513 [Fusarium coicis]KAG9499965.1 hypothetical protein J7337_008429 [Fusarium musae]
MEVQNATPTGPWQDQLDSGRTAWSSRVTVHGKTLAARFWYDGKNLNNAREDAAECAVKWLTGSESSSPTQQWGW